MSTPRCKPGDLVLMLTGPDTGKTFTVVRLMPRSQIWDLLIQALGTACRFEATDHFWKETFWELDRPVIWEGELDGVYRTVTISAAPDTDLLPITPPASMTTKEQSKELSHG